MSQIQNDAGVALVDELRYEACSWSEATNPEMVDLLHAAADEIERLRISISDSSPRWIPVGERKPDDEQMVLACWAGPSTAPGIETVRYYAADAPDGPETWHDAYDARSDAPTHWMPLPEAPK